MHHDGSSSIRSPAVVFGRLMTSPLPLIRRTVPLIATVPASRSTSAQQSARTSPMRAPLAIMKPTRSPRSLRVAIMS